MIGPLYAAILGSSAALATTTTTLTFKEPERGSTLAYVDVAPTAPKVDGFPISISPGDQIIFTNSVTEGGKAIGKLRARCTATTAVGKITEAAFAQAHFICEGVYTLPGGSLYVNGTFLKSGTEGVVTGGTRKYAGDRGMFVAKNAKHGTETTITLLSD